MIKKCDQDPEITTLQQKQINKKSCLKRINENIRRRIKIKDEEEEQTGRSLSSATVSLSNLINL
jgi:hypothetical protein